MKTREIGKINEDLAVDYLKKRNYRIVERNFRRKFGEIDIIAKDRDTLVFIEVRSRKDDFFGSPLESIDQKKIRKISRTALSFISKTDQEFSSIRFDVISIVNGEIEHIENAFEVEYN